MIIDPITVLVTSFVIALVMTVMMFYYWRTRQTYDGFGYWLLGDIYVTASFLLIALRGIIPDLFSVWIGNILLIHAMVTIFQGIHRFYGKESRDKLNIIILIIYSVTFGYFIYIEDSMPWRIVMSSAVIAILMYRAGVLLLFKSPEKLKSSTRPGGLMMWLTGAFFLARLIDAIINFSTYDLFSPRPINLLGFMMGALLVSTWTFGFFFLNSERLELELEAAQEELEEKVITDYLTGVHNRRYFFEQGQLELERARRYQHSICLIIIDTDNFKTINDKYGHAAGDMALKEIACIIKGKMRRSDIFARLGGEEFVVLLIKSDKQRAMKTAERMRKEIGQKSISFNNHQFSITISAGISELEDGDIFIQEVLQRADQALYRAKDHGKNLVSE